MLISSSARTFKPNALRLGFVPLVDMAPLAVAKEFGLFSAAGVDVELVREPGWATVRDKLVLGRELHGAHALAGLAFAASYGIDCVARHCLTGFVINRHGNGVTLSRQLWDQGIRTMAEIPKAVSQGAHSKLRLGIVHSASSHHFLLRSLLGRSGLMLDRDAEIVTLPPELMPSALERGTIDGFCAGEPWNSVAIDSGTGFCVATSPELCFAHPEKILLVSADFAEQRHEEHLALIAALKVAVRLCDDESERDGIVKLLSRPEYLDIDRSIIANSLGGVFHRGFDQYAGAEAIHTFSGDDVNRPSSDKADLIVGQLRDCGLLPEGVHQSGPKPSEIFRADLYDAPTPTPVDPPTSKRRTAPLISNQVIENTP